MKRKINFMKENRIGLFGGTFNPIHTAHIKAAEVVQKKMSLDKILFVPSFIPPHKNFYEIASPFHRLKMVKLAISPYSSFIPSSIEIEAGEKSYSIITLQKIKERYPNFLIFFIIGIDAFLEIETWKSYEELLEEYFFVVMSRPGFCFDDVKKILEGRYNDRFYELSKEEVIKEKISSFKIFLLSINGFDVSSTEVRERIKKGLSIKGLVPETVALYIKKNKLYQKRK